MTNNAEREAFEKWYATDEAWGETPKELAWRTWQAHAQASGVPDGCTKDQSKLTYLIEKVQKTADRLRTPAYWFIQGFDTRTGHWFSGSGAGHEGENDAPLLAATLLDSFAELLAAPTPPKSASVPVERLEAFISQHGADATHACDEYEVLASLKELIAEYKALPLSEVE